MLVSRRPRLGRLIGYVGWPVLLLLVYDFAVVFSYEVLDWKWLGSPHVPLTLYGSAIGIIVGFRNNSSYGRWWEARQLWGSVVNNSRSFARQALTGLRSVNDPESALVQKKLVYRQIAYVHALRAHLRGLQPWDELVRLLPADELSLMRVQRNVPLALQQRQGMLARECRDRGWLDPIAWQSIDRSIDDLADAQGGCERIKNTPMPKQYDWFPQLFVQIYCFFLPLGMVQDLHWFTPIGSTLVGFMFLALDKIGRDLEDPFDNSIFDVPLTSITRGIEINLRQLLGETELPEPTVPDRDVLW